MKMEGGECVGGASAGLRGVIKENENANRVIGGNWKIGDHLPTGIDTFEQIAIIDLMNYQMEISRGHEIGETNSRTKQLQLIPLMRG